MTNTSYPYHYAYSSPMTWRDPSGLAPEKEKMRDKIQFADVDMNSESHDYINMVHDNLSEQDEAANERLSAWDRGYGFYSLLSSYQKAFINNLANDEWYNFVVNAIITSIFEKSSNNEAKSEDDGAGEGTVGNEAKAGEEGRTGDESADDTKNGEDLYGSNPYGETSTSEPANYVEQASTQDDANDGNEKEEIWGKMFVCSDVLSDRASLIDGHAWIRLEKSDGVIITMSLWGNKGEQEFWINLELNMGYGVSKSTNITYLQYDQIIIFNSNPSNINWTPWHTCAGYSADLWNFITKDNLTAEDSFGFTTPRSLSKSIRKKD